MTPELIKIVVDTFENNVKPAASIVATAFYDKLFQLDPTLRSMFPKDMDAQKAKLVDALSLAVNHLDKKDDLSRVLRSLGRRHIAYGVADKDYDTVGVALMSTLAEGLGSAFTPEVSRAWYSFYGYVSSEMIAGTR